MSNPADETKTDGKPLNLVLGVSTPEKRIPKYCNAALYTRLNDDGGIIITLLANERIGAGEDAQEESMVIERIFLDKNHALAMGNKIIQMLTPDEDEQK